MSQLPFCEESAAGGDPVGPPGSPNWRDGDSYRPLLQLDREGWAWEWLRRNPAYREYIAAVPFTRGAGVTPAPVLPSRDGADWGIPFR